MERFWSCSEREGCRWKILSGLRFFPEVIRIEASFMFRFPRSLAGLILCVGEIAEFRKAVSKKSRQRGTLEKEAFYNEKVNKLVFLQQKCLGIFGSCSLSPISDRRLQSGIPFSWIVLGGGDALPFALVLQLSESSIEVSYSESAYVPCQFLTTSYVHTVTNPDTYTRTCIPSLYRFIVQCNLNVW